MKRGIVFSVESLAGNTLTYIYPLKKDDWWDSRFQRAKEKGEKILVRTECYVDKGLIHFRIDLPTSED